MRFTLKSLSAWWLVPLLSVASFATTGSDLRLIEAVKNQDSGAVRSLLKQHVNVNAAEADGATALAWAAYQGDLATVEILIRAGANVNATNSYGVTPLALAAQNGNAAMVQRLLQAGADAKTAQTSGVTALMEASRTGNAEAVKALLAHGAAVNAKDSSRGQTALMWAVAERHTEIAQLLVKAGADVNACSNGGFTPLLFAAQQGDLDSAKILLGAGANANQAAPEEGSALVLATHSGHEDLAIFLLEKGADPNATDTYGITALHYSVMKGLARLAGMRPISGAEYWYRPNMPNLVKVLLDHGANPNVQIAKFPPLPGTRHFKDIDMTPVGATPFLLAATSYDAGIMRLLLAKGADPKLTDKDHNTPLILAAGFAEGITHAVQRPAQDDKDSLEAVQLLVNDLGADVNETDEIGETPLLGAAYVGANDIIQFLVDKGAKVDAANRYQQTPWSLAAQFMTVGVGKDKDLRPRNGHETTAALLLKLGAKPLPQEMLASAAAE